VVAEDGRLADFRDEGGGDLCRAVVRAAELAGVDGGVILRVFDEIGRFDFSEHRADLLVGELLVRQPREQRHLVPAVLGALGRHVRLLVPVQDRRGRAEQADLFAGGDEADVRVCRVTHGCESCGDLCGEAT
jgi:hypothetical protein